jgi:hypothetical protein
LVKILPFAYKNIKPVLPKPVKKNETFPSNIQPKQLQPSCLVGALVISVMTGMYAGCKVIVIKPDNYN